ncbi:MAG: stage V sporulation protein AC [Clostridia bacterium]|nr:stage V sporulation protein AC [Clostridia bacterium]
MNMTNEEYNAYVSAKAPKSKLWLNCLKAFCIGGGICTVAQGFFELYTYFGMSRDSAAPLTTVTMIFIGALLTGLNIYPKIARHGGAGTLVPVTGFANAVTAPALEAKTEGFITGTGTKIFTIAGPVILYGTFTSVICGIIYYLWGLV